MCSLNLMSPDFSNTIPGAGGAADAGFGDGGLLPHRWMQLTPDLTPTNKPQCPGAQLLRFHFEQLSQSSLTITPTACPHIFSLGTSFSAGCLATTVIIRDFLYVYICF